MNCVCLTGRITKEPELRYTPNGNSTVSFTLAVDRGFKDANGNKQSDFISCVAWRSQADFIAKYIHKGYMLAVEGQIQTRNYQTSDGSTRYVTEVVVDNVENLQPRDQNQQQPQYNQYQQPNQQYNQNQYQNNAQYNPNYNQQQYQQPNAYDIRDEDLPF